MPEINIEIRSMLLYYFRKGYKAAEAAREICKTQENAISIRTSQSWFKRFKEGDCSLESRRRTGLSLTSPPTEVSEMYTATSKCSTNLEIPQSTMIKRERKKTQMFNSSCDTEGRHNLSNANNQLLVTSFIKEELISEEEDADHSDYGTKSLDIAVKKEIKNEEVDLDNSCSEGVNLVNSSVEIEIKKERLGGVNVINSLSPVIKNEVKLEELSDEVSSSVAAMCQVWLGSDENGFPPENCSGGEILDGEYIEQSEESHLLGIMPHFLVGAAELKLASCQLCGETCTKENYLEHQKNKHGFKRKGLSSKEGKRRPTKNKPKHDGFIYPCPYCDKSKESYSSLKTHLLSHSDDKPYKCPFCDISQKTNLRLIMHIKEIHYRITTYKCTSCDYITNIKSNFKRHNRKHRLTMRQCPHCSVFKPTGVALIRHIKSAHKKKEKKKNQISHDTTRISYLSMK